MKVPFNKGSDREVKPLFHLAFFYQVFTGGHWDKT